LFIFFIFVGTDPLKQPKKVKKSTRKFEPVLYLLDLLKAELWIRIHWTPDLDPAFKMKSDSNTDPDPGIYDQKLKTKIQPKFFLSIVDQKLQFTYVQATGEAFSPQKRTWPAR
jgi:hypothetical protein